MKPPKRKVSRAEFRGLKPIAGRPVEGNDMDPSSNRGVKSDNSRTSRAVPAPRTPIADSTYDLLKQKAKTVRLARSKHSQEDSSET